MLMLNDIEDVHGNGRKENRDLFLQEIHPSMCCNTTLGEPDMPAEPRYQIDVRIWLRALRMITILAFAFFGAS